MTKDKKLSTFESIALVAGNGLGTGLLTIPYAIHKVGVVGTFAVLVVAFIATYLLNSYLADLAIRSKNPRNLVDVLKEHLFKGRFKNLYAAAFFILLALLVIEDLVVYTLCASDVLATFLHLDINAIKLLFSLIASFLLFSGIKEIGVGEKFVVGAIGVVVAVLASLSFFNINNTITILDNNFGNMFALYGLFMFAFSSMFAMIQVSGEIADKKNLKKVIFYGLLANAITTIVYSTAAILCSKEITQLSTIGIMQSLNMPIVSAGCSILVLAAMFSSYWTTSLALIDAMSLEFKWNKDLCIIICIGITALISMFVPLTIIDYVKIGAGTVSLLFGVSIIPAYYNATKGQKETLIMGKYCQSKILMGLTIVLTALTVIASFMSIN